MVRGERASREQGMLSRALNAIAPLVPASLILTMIMMAMWTMSVYYLWKYCRLVASCFGPHVATIFI